MTRLIVRSMLAHFEGAAREFIAMRVSGPVYTTTPRHQAVFLSCVPRRRSCCGPRAASVDGASPEGEPSDKVPVKLWIDFCG
eukprot:CAMPEP_0176072910 /NCGR_PEP_ID=MMETSP0120_2-20121206/36428_1 /TAXON_ID=160619 /ORGANISM="Kryptoperidinium foliaceum, Strain CCMP 1326" /LENGTH=81 /DNA_ID=CAMNT_0017406589 /DNA_START=25 /DNA_END=267 /DNA_ORIENTATION=+